MIFFSPASNTRTHMQTHLPLFNFFSSFCFVVAVFFLKCYLTAARKKNTVIINSTSTSDTCEHFLWSHSSGLAHFIFALFSFSLFCRLCRSCLCYRARLNLSISCRTVCNIFYFDLTLQWKTLCMVRSLAYKNRENWLDVHIVCERDFFPFIYNDYSTDIILHIKWDNEISFFPLLSTQNTCDRFW